MNSDVDSNNAAVYYYDSDYPSPDLSLYPENFDEVTEYQGLAFDVPRYKELATAVGGPILELCCGTGRVAIPLAMEGFDVCAVDISRGMLDQFGRNLQKQVEATRSRITLVQQDITSLVLERRDFQLAIIAFNSLLCITDFEAQCRAFQAVATHLAPTGMLVIDLVNPLNLKIHGDANPKPFFTRRNTHNGNQYTRFAMMDPFDEDHRQRLHGWYDEMDADGTVRRRHYSMHWRPIFRFEIDLMLRQASLQICKIEGGHLKEPYTAQSPRMFIQARKATASL